MSRRAVLGVPAALVVALAGCGSDRETAASPAADVHAARFGPATPVPRSRPPASRPHARPPSAAVARALARGSVGVIDVTGAVGVRPALLSTSADATVERLHWSRWDAGGATGSGELRLLTCDPTCAQGTLDRLPATVALSRPRVCGGRQYFDEAEIRLDAGGGPEGTSAPASYLRAPC